MKHLRTLWRIIICGIESLVDDDRPHQLEFDFEKEKPEQHYLVHPP